MSTNLKNPFAYDKNKNLIYIKDKDFANMDLYKDCYCVECGQKLIAKMGHKNTWHFSHYTEKQNESCNGGFETSIHLFAKEILKSNNEILMPKLDLYDYLKISGLYNKFCERFNIYSDDEFDDELIRENLRENIYLKENVYKYTWKANEIVIDDIIPDTLVSINDKDVAIEILATHRVDANKTNKTIAKNLDMIEIDLSKFLTIYNDKLLNNKSFDIESYILKEAPRKFIYKTPIKEYDYKIFNDIDRISLYRTSKAIDEDLEEQNKIYNENLQKQIKYNQNNRKYILKVLEQNSKITQSEDYNVSNIPVQAEYLFSTPRDIWQRKIYDHFILGKGYKSDGWSIISYNYIRNWVRMYSNIKFIINTNDTRIEDRYSYAIRDYLYKLEQLGVIECMKNGDYISAIRVKNNDEKRANDIIKKIKFEENNILVCQNCGELFEKNDLVNRFYLKYFGKCKECFEEWFNQE